MDRLKENINKQIKFNQDKNILYKNLELFQFANETVKAISTVERLDPDSIKFLINYATDKAIEEFCRVNQYYSFDSKAKDDLRNIYAQLIESFKAKKNSIEEISKKHYENLNKWLKNSNPFAGKIYINADKTIKPVACSEYSQDLQVDILKIDLEHLMQPVLDIGCGREARLVSYLRNQGIEAYGIDRYNFSKPYLITADWLEYNYTTEKWGTIISNVGFSNHFNHHNLREDGNYIGYAKTYMNILHSLKTGGCFHYAPDLPFIEKYLDNRQFSVEKYEIHDYEFKTTIIKRG